MAAEVAQVKAVSDSERWNLWFRPTDVEESRYVLLPAVAPSSTVDEVIARCISAERLSARPSLVSLRLVKHGLGKPTAAEEKLATPLVDPSETLLDVGVSNGSWLLLVVPVTPVVPSAADTKLLLAFGRLGIFKTGPPPGSASSVQSNLRQSALSAYGLVVTGGMLTCPVLLIPLPASAVTCAHLVPRQLREQWKELGIAEDDPRNVVFMFKSIVEAFDDYLLSFIRSGSMDADGRDLFRVHVWDPTLLDVLVTMNVRNRSERRVLPGVQLPASLERVTYRSLHEGAPVALAGPSGLSPFRRALVLQAVLARANAATKPGWPDAPAELDEESVSPELSPEKEEVVRAWRITAAAASAAAVAGAAPTTVSGAAPLPT